LEGLAESKTLKGEIAVDAFCPDFGGRVRVELETQGGTMEGEWRKPWKKCEAPHEGSRRPVLKGLVLIGMWRRQDFDKNLSPS
jgi:hypothetical protein